MAGPRGPRGRPARSRARADIRVDSAPVRGVNRVAADQARSSRVTRVWPARKT